MHKLAILNEEIVVFGKSLTVNGGLLSHLTQQRAILRTPSKDRFPLLIIIY